jgi:hypothetical protein
MGSLVYSSIDTNLDCQFNYQSTRLEHYPWVRRIVGCSSSYTKTIAMQLLHLYRELSDQFRQWMRPRDQRHLESVSEAVAAIL